MSEQDYREIASKAEWAAQELKQAERDIGHVREMTEALDRNMLKVEKLVEALGMKLNPILSPVNTVPSRPEDDAPIPARCPLADDLGKMNDRLYEVSRRIDIIAGSVDI